MRRSDPAAWERLFVRTQASGRPLQVRLREMVVTAINEGWIKAGGAVPSSRALARRLGVARNTVLLAYQQLVDDEILEARERSGYFARETGRRPPPARQEAASPRRAKDWRARFAVRPSARPNIVKPRDWLAFPYPFVYGQFDPTLFPINDWRECARQALSVLEIRGWAADRIDREDPELVEQIRTHVLPRRGVWATADQIMITLGAQQALYLLAELLVRPGTVVGMEEPGYPDARNIFALRSADLRLLPVDEAGIDPEGVPEACRLLFLTPTRQCPTGVRMPLERRQRLLEVARDRDLVLVEDDYESNFGLSPHPVMAMRALDESGTVLYVGSLSKILAPGLRVGYIVAPNEVIREARALRRLMLRHPPTNNQRALALFLGHGHFDRFLRKSVEVLAERARTLKEGLRRHLPGFAFGGADGGSSVWVRGPDGLDSRALAERARGAGVLIDSGDVFFHRACGPNPYFRLGFFSIPTARIEPGLKRLAEQVDAPG